MPPGGEIQKHKGTRNAIFKINHNAKSTVNAYEKCIDCMQSGCRTTGWRIQSGYRTTGCTVEDTVRL